MTSTVWSVTVALPDQSPWSLGTVSAASGAAAGALVAARWPLYPPGCVWLASDTASEAAPDGLQCLADVLGCPDGPPEPDTASTGLLAPVAAALAPPAGIMAQLRARGLTPGQRKVRDRKAQLARSERLRAHYQAKVTNG
jgi:hypothetical protein